MRSLRCLLIIAIFGCQSAKEKAEAEAETPKGPLGMSDADRAQVVARVNGVAITVGEFADRINKQSPYIRARYTSVERKKEFLDNLVRFEVLAAEAQKRGFDKDEEVVHAQKQAMIQKLMKAEFTNATEATDVPEEELKKFYDEHISEYQKPEQVRVSQVVTKDKSAATKVASQARAKPQDAKLFRELVNEHSIDEDSKAHGGDLRYFGRDDAQVPQAVREAAFELKKVGDVAGPLQTDQGFVVIKLTGRRRELNRTFDEVKRQIQNRLYRQRRTQRMEDFVAGLKSKAKIEVFEEKLELVPVDIGPGTGQRGGVRGVRPGGMPGAPVRVPPARPAPMAPPSGAKQP